MRALDTNILIYAEDRASPRRETALDLLQSLANGPAPWAIPWPCIYEFLRVATHPRALRSPLPMSTAQSDLRAITASPSLLLLAETERHLQVLEQVLRDSGVTGSLLHDAHIAALCIEHGVSELVTADRDFRRFRGLRIQDPFHD